MSDIIYKNGMAIVDGDIISDWMEERGLECDLMLRDILPHIKQGDWVVDVGAAMGDHTSAYLRTVGPTGKVFAFEPNPSYFKCLQHNCPKAVLIDRPLWHNNTDVFWLHSPLGNQGGGYLNKDSTSIYPGEICSGPVAPMMLDDLDLSRLDLMKLDCEGAEFNALRGAERTILKFRPKLVIEMNPGPTERMGHTHMDIYNMLDQWNYDYKSICNEPERHCKSCDILCWSK